MDFLQEHRVKHVRRKETVEDAAAELRDHQLKEPEAVEEVLQWRAPPKWTSSRSSPGCFPGPRRPRRRNPARGNMRAVLGASFRWRRSSQPEMNSWGTARDTWGRHRSFRIVFCHAGSCRELSRCYKVYIAPPRSTGGDHRLAQSTKKRLFVFIDKMGKFFVFRLSV